MPNLNGSNIQPPAGKYHRNYLALSERALQHYPLDAATTTFIQHNAGIVFRVEEAITGQSYLLKVHMRDGVGANPTATQLEAGLSWLSGLSAQTDLVVQTPMRMIAGPFVCQIETDIGETVNATLQRWIEGSVPHGDFTMRQAEQLGEVMAKLHAYSRQQPVSHDIPAFRCDTTAMAVDINTLRDALDTTVLSSQDYAILVAAHTKIEAVMTDLGTAPDVWGAVHGDLHYDNVLLYHDEIRPIDFTGICLAHYLYDLGVTLYHIHYQGPEIRRAFLNGYQYIQRLPDGHNHFLDTFITCAAISSLAWNSTVPEQVASPLFRRNLQQMITTFCTHVIEGKSFLI